MLSPRQDDFTSKSIEVSSGDVINSMQECNHTSNEATAESISEPTVIKPAAQQTLLNHEYSENNLESSNSVVAQTADVVNIPGSDNDACATNKTYSLSSESCSDVVDINQVADSQLHTVQVDVSPEEEVDQSESQPDITSCDNHMQLVAMACYETIMEMVKDHKCDSSIDSDIVKSNCGFDGERLQQPKPVSLDLFLAEETRAAQPKQTESSDANMQHMAMACYETVMEMVRNDDILSSSMNNGQHDGSHSSPLLENHHLPIVYPDEHVTVNVSSLHERHVPKQVDHYSDVQPSTQSDHYQLSEGVDNVELPQSDNGTVDSLQQVAGSDVLPNANNGLLQAKLLEVTENMTAMAKYDATTVNKKPSQGSSCKKKFDHNSLHH